MRSPRGRTTSPPATTASSPRTTTCSRRRTSPPIRTPRDWSARPRQHQPEPGRPRRLAGRKPRRVRLHQCQHRRQRLPVRGLRSLAHCAEALGKSDDAKALRGRADTLATAVRDTLLDASACRFLDGVGTSHSAQHATAFPVALGVADSLDAEVLARLGDTLAAGGMKVSVYGAQFLLDALFRLGRADAVPPNSRAVLEVETGDADPSAYRVTATPPGGRGRVTVKPFTGLTGTVLRIRPVGSGTAEVEHVSS
ncbi:alpha-L-rhamnosidase-related protein [Streptomyces sp. SD31]|uniref:alpha-L-rhamnosidase-related protein n=1 Tax=Streptomyces sp. SD31 TaxID=3452208 RepID=UPI003F8C8111